MKDQMAIVLLIASSLLSYQAYSNTSNEIKSESGETTTTPGYDLEEDSPLNFAEIDYSPCAINFFCESGLANKGYYSNLSIEEDLLTLINRAFQKSLNKSKYKYITFIDSSFAIDEYVYEYGDLASKPKKKFYRTIDSTGLLTRDKLPFCTHNEDLVFGFIIEGQIVETYYQDLTYDYGPQPVYKDDWILYSKKEFDVQGTLLKETSYQRYGQVDEEIDYVSFNFDEYIGLFSKYILQYNEEGLLSGVQKISESSGEKTIIMKLSWLPKKVICVFYHDDETEQGKKEFLFDSQGLIIQEKYFEPDISVTSQKDEYGNTQVTGGSIGDLGVVRRVDYEYDNNCLSVIKEKACPDMMFTEMQDTRVWRFNYTGQ